jgi:hypothetical protein
MNIKLCYVKQDEFFLNSRKREVRKEKGGKEIENRRNDEP